MIMAVLMIVPVFTLKEVLLQGWVVNLLLRFLLVGMSVTVTTATTFSVIMFPSKVVVSLARMQDLHLYEVENKAHDSDN